MTISVKPTFDKAFTLKCRPIIFLSVKIKKKLFHKYGTIIEAAGRVSEMKKKIKEYFECKFYYTIKYNLWIIVKRLHK